VCQVAGASEVGDFRASSLGTLVEMVLSGVGITLLPTLAVEAVRRTGSGLRLVPFASPAPRRTIGLAWRPSSARQGEFELLGEIMRAQASTAG
jgi:LysR family hydrogen peroxide-inducible transcriptional activator